MNCGRGTLFHRECFAKCQVRAERRAYYGPNVGYALTTLFFISQESVQKFIRPFRGPERGCTGECGGPAWRRSSRLNVAPPRQRGNAQNATHQRIRHERKEPA